MKGNNIFYDLYLGAKYFAPRYHACYRNSTWFCSKPGCRCIIRLIFLLIIQLQNKLNKTLFIPLSPYLLILWGHLLYLIMLDHNFAFASFRSFHYHHTLRWLSYTEKWFHFNSQVGDVKINSETCILFLFTLIGASNRNYLF